MKKMTLTDYAQKLLQFMSLVNVNNELKIPIDAKTVVSYRIVSYCTVSYRNCFLLYSYHTVVVSDRTASYRIVL